MDCPICLASIDHQKCETPCGHFFHSACIFKSLQNSNLCPICRTSLVEPLKSSNGSRDFAGSTVSSSGILGVSILRVFDPTYVYSESSSSS